MTTIYNDKQVKRAYQAPAIEMIKLDNEISLILASTPPAGPGESDYLSPEYFDENPYQD